MKKVFLLLLALAIGFIRLPLFSQEVAQPQIQEQKKAETAAPKRATSTFVIGEVVVRDKHSLNIEDASTTTTITGEEIKQRSDKSLADSLQMVPGVVVSQTAKGFTGFSMRGFQHERIAILIDGIPVLDPYYGGGNTDISNIPVQNVDKIVVNRGASSALYGAFGSIGSINIITKQPEKVYAEANAEYGEQNNYTINGAAGAPIGNFYAWVNASIRHSDGYEISKKLDSSERRKWFDKLVNYSAYGKTSPDSLLATQNYLNDTGLWNHTSFDKYQASGRAGYNFTRDIEAGVSVSWYTNEQENNSFASGTLSSFSPPSTWKTPSNWTTDKQNAAFQNRAFVWDEDSRYTIAPYLRADFGDLKVRVNTFFVRQRNDLLAWFDQNHTVMYPPSVYPKSSYSNAHIHSIFEETAYGFSIIPTYDLTSWNKLSATIHFRVEDHKKIEKAYDDGLQAQTTALIALYGTGDYTVLEMQASYITLALEDQINFTTGIGRFGITLGVSYDAQNFNHFQLRNDGTLPGTVNEMVDGYMAGDDSMIWGTRDSFNPVLAVVYDPIRDLLRFRTAFAIKTNFPNLSIYKDITASSDFTVEPERIYSANAGFELFFLNSALSFRSDYFYTRINNKIVKAYDPDRSTAEFYSNIDGYIAQGVENSIQGTIDRIGSIMDIQTSVGYIYTYAQNRDHSYVTMGEDVERTPVHQFIVQVICNFISGTRVTLWGNYIRNQVVYTMASDPSVTSPGVFTTDVFSTTKLHNPLMFHIKIQQNFLDHYHVYVMCRNIFDDYDADPFNPGPGRMFYFGGGAQL